MTARRTKDYGSVSETYNNEDLLYDYVGILSCSKSDFYFEIKLNKKKQIIYLDISK